MLRLSSFFFKYTLTLIKGQTSRHTMEGSALYAKHQEFNQITITAIIHISLAQFKYRPKGRRGYPGTQLDIYIMAVQKLQLKYPCNPPQSCTKAALSQVLSDIQQYSTNAVRTNVRHTKTVCDEIIRLSVYINMTTLFLIANSVSQSVYPAYKFNSTQRATATASPGTILFNSYTQHSD